MDPVNTTPDPTATLPDSAKDWFFYARRYAKAVVILLFAFVYSTQSEVYGQAPSSGSSVTIAWEEDPTGGIAGYRVYYGTESRRYTESVAVGQATTATITGLTAGVVYYFAVTAIDPTGLESDFSDEISFIPGLRGLPEADGITIRVGATREVTLIVRGVDGQGYEIEATEDFDTWTRIGTVTMGEDGYVEFSDAQAARFRTRFYRTRKTP